MANIRNEQSVSGTVPRTEPTPEVIEFDEADLEASGTEEPSPEQDDKILFAKSTDIRRRIEEKLEVRVLRDELGMDDLDL